MEFPIAVVLILYVAVAACLVLFSNKASVYVDLLDKKTSLSGAFIGGVLLSAVTSLPELFTSISSALLLDKPGLAMGNILGSNLFNLTLLAVLVLVFLNAFSRVHIAKGHSAVAMFTFFIFLLIYLNYRALLAFSFATVSLTSILIIVLYIFGVRSLSQEDADSDQDVADHNPLSVKQVVVRFILVSIAIVSLSICITYLTDDIATTFHLGNGLAGALFLGIATSLPELASTIALFRMGNYNIALGNIIGSNLFNFMILGITDVLYLGQGIYDFSDPKTVILLICGMIATPLFFLLTRLNKKPVCILAALGTIACYVGFLVL